MSDNFDYWLTLEIEELEVHLAPGCPFMLVGEIEAVIANDGRVDNIWFWRREAGQPVPVAAPGALFDLIAAAIKKHYADEIKAHCDACDAYDEDGGDPGVDPGKLLGMELL